MLAAVALAVIGLLVWATIATLSWLWGQAPAVAGAGTRLAGEAVTQIEQAAPGLQDQLSQWVPALLKEPLERWVPGIVDGAPAGDVSGADVGPVSRYPGLVRSYFARDGQLSEVRYTGRAAAAAVLAHYVQGFTAAGYTQQVISAAPEGEQHRFERDQDVIVLSLLRQPHGLVDVRLKVSSP
ncbi:MAG: hypothetical protein ABIO58_08245 [Luteimonas sp.]